MSDEPISTEEAERIAHSLEKWEGQIGAPAATPYGPTFSHILKAVHHTYICRVGASALRALAAERDTLLTSETAAVEIDRLAHWIEQLEEENERLQEKARRSYAQGYAQGYASGSGENQP